MRNKKDGGTIYKGLERQGKWEWLQIDQVEPEMPQKTPQVAEPLLLGMNTYTELCLRLIQPWQNI